MTFSRISARLSTVLLFGILTFAGCSTFDRRMAWSKAALVANAGDEKKPSTEEINGFFTFEKSQSHPYFSVDFQKELDAQTHSELTANNTLTLLPNRTSLQTKLKLIADAKETVYVATFHLICDAGGIEFAQALSAAAGRGVDVRFLGTGGPWGWWFSGKCPSDMSNAKVKVAHTPYSLLTNRGVVQLHDKILVVDAKYAVVGGQNIGSWYSDSDGRDRHFRDTDVSIEGPAVNAIAQRFTRLWRMAKPTDYSLDAYDARLEKQQEEAFRAGHVGVQNYENWLKQPFPSGLCRFVAQDPHQKTYYVFDAYRLYARNAEKRVVFHTPFLNSLGSNQQTRLWRAISGVARKSGGKVFVLTNGPGLVSSAMLGPRLGTLAGYYFLSGLYESTLDEPVDIFAYRSWLHSKVYYFDGIAVGIGSFNFDETGLVWTENTLICIDPSLVEQTTTMLKNDFEHSIKLDRPQGSDAKAS